MKHSVRRQQLSVALFPFLAVLICTMGALIVLLVLFTHQASARASSTAASFGGGAADPEMAKQLRERLEDASWRREMLEGQRAEKAQKLAEERARLAHLEQHIQELQAKAKELLARARQIDEGKTIQDEQLAAQRAELARLKDEIARKQLELDEARRKQATEERWYALIPYDGPNGTRRRPIYIECTDAGIVIQPEGIVFRPDDFNGPMGPGNPLDAALRTIREHLQSVHAKTGEPYPLLVVRPSGVVAYGAARAALKAWDDEFGYELISDDKRLAYGDPDPVLAESLNKTVKMARLRQVALAAAMPRKFNGEEPLTSFDPANVPGLGSAPGGGAGSGKPGRGVGNGSGGTASSGGDRGGFGGFSQSAAEQLGSGPSLGSPTGDAASPATGAGGPGGRPGPYPTTGAPGGAYGSAAGGTGGGAARAGAAGAASLRPGATQFSGPGSGNAGQAAGGSPGTASPGAPGGSMAAGAAGGVRSGKSRGANWGLPGAAGRSTGITRPIHVAVLADRFVLVPDPGDDRPPKHLRISPVMAQAEADALVTAVQKEMTGWGLAVENGYWKPVLEVEVAPDAERHFADLETALQNSGFEIQRKP
jgi:hypothetical protein